MNAITADTIGAIRDSVRGNVRPALSNSIATESLRSFVERLEDRDAERQCASEDIADIMQEVKSAGFNPQVVRQLITQRKKERKDAAKVQEQADLLELYKAAVVGM